MTYVGLQHFLTYDFQNSDYFTNDLRFEKNYGPDLRQTDRQGRCGEGVIVNLVLLLILHAIFVGKFRNGDYISQHLNVNLFGFVLFVFFFLLLLFQDKAQDPSLTDQLTYLICEPKIKIKFYLNSEFQKTNLFFSKSNLNAAKFLSDFI